MAQTPLTEDLKLARKNYELQNFEQARILYESVEVYTVLDLQDQRKLAHIYEATGDREEALRRSQVILQSPEATNDDFLALADLYKKETRYDEALFTYESYARRGGRDARRYIEGVEFAKNILQFEKNCDLENLAFNTSSAESGATFYNGDLVFATHRVDLSGKFGIKGSLDNRPKSVLLKVDEKHTTHPIKTQDREGDEFGFAAYSGNGRMMVYVKSDFDPKEAGLSHSKDIMALYYSIADEYGVWEEDKAFPFNSTAYANGFPYLTEDGNTLFYASNMKEGFGGYDLYVSHFKNGQWTIPQNLGDAVNTPGNEITPFLSRDKLYFASDYLPGLGGYDVYSIMKVNNDWVDLHHMGACVNSPEDDYGYVLNPDKSSAYFTSTRLGGKGHDDLYKINDAQSINEYTIVQPQANTLPTLALNEQSSGFTFKSPNAKEEVSIPPLQITNQVEQEKAHAHSILGEREMKTIENMEEAHQGNKALSSMPMGLFDHLTETDHAAIALQSQDAIETLETPKEDLDKWDVEGLLIMEDPNIFDLNLEAFEKVYFIQIAALSTYTKDLSRFEHFKKYGNVYAMKVGTMTKIRLGYYQTMAEAIKVLKVLKEKGIKEAFIVGDILDANRLNLIASRYEEINAFEDDNLVSSYRSKYKVRVAAYRLPSRFDTKKISDLGHIEHWTKGEWKIIVLSGFSKKDQAEYARLQCAKRGFKDAFIVKDENGELVRAD